ncbi:hypothetical protein H9P43_000797 [Blastocladiella emersonii ATCC 22665]|nr:hypothetical protein H9P43_000797 [Blastocladiella emersonii ATCC 22665]
MSAEDAEIQSLLKHLYGDRGPGKRRVKPNQAQALQLAALARSSSPNGPGGGGGNGDDGHETEASDHDFEAPGSDADDASEGSALDDDEAGGDAVPPQPLASPAARNRTVLTRRVHRAVPDPDTCCVCMSALSHEDVVLLFCEGEACSVTVHPGCYGLSSVPEGEWKCDACSFGSWPAHCILCPVRYGAMKRLASGQGWAHVVCTTWIRDAHFLDAERLADISVARIPPRDWLRPCAICGLVEGVTVPCDAGRCPRRVHVSCCAEHDLVEEVRDEPGLANPMFLVCPQHGAERDASRVKLNKWGRWARAHALPSSASAVADLAPDAQAAALAESAETMRLQSQLAFLTSIESVLPKRGQRLAKRAVAAFASVPAAELEHEDSDELDPPMPLDPRAGPSAACADARVCTEASAAADRAIQGRCRQETAS